MADEDATSEGQGGEDTAAGDAFREEHEAPAFLQPLLDRLRASAKTETVFGPSREEGGRRVVPVAKVSYGAGGGSGRSGRKGAARPGASSMPGAGEGDEGTGVGAGITVSPLGVFEVADDGMRFVPVDSSKFISLAAFAGGILLGLVVGGSRGPGKR